MKLFEIGAAMFGDRRLLAITLLISLFGLVMIGSASSEISAQGGGSPFAMLLRHSIYLAISVGIFTLIVRIPFAMLVRLRFPVLLTTLALLILVLIPEIGKEVNGARRWIITFGLSMQPAELAKIAVIIYLATFLGKMSPQDMNLAKLAPGIIVSLCAVMLILVQPDFGTALIVFAIAFGVFYCAGIGYRLVFSGIIIALVAFGFFLYIQPYRLKRFEAILDPWGHAFDSGYQLTQALMAIGRGGWFGSGLGKSIQKFFYLPEAHTDFLIAVTIEELGLVSCIILLIFYVFLILKIASVARRAMLSGQRIAGLFVYGVFFYLSLQSAIAWGVNLAILPTTGVSLPLFSYGGTSMLVSYALLGVTQRISMETESQHKAKKSRRSSNA